MSGTPKYVKFQLNDNDKSHFIVIDAGQTHDVAVKNLANALDSSYQVLSAGFLSCGVDAEDDKFSMSTYGASTSLKRAGHPHESVEYDGVEFLQSNDDMGLFFAIHSNGSLDSTILLSPSLTPDQVNEILKHKSVKSLGRTRLFGNENHEVTCEIVEQIQLPDTSMRDNQISIISKMFSPY